jgi:predicted glycosyltransferase
VPINHVGYVGTPVPDSGPRDLEGGYLLVTAGAGFDGFPLIATFAHAVRLRPLGCRSVIVTGPLMAPAQRRRIRDVTTGLDIEVHELRRDMESVIAGARAVVSMAGYNTVSELMRARKPALLVPRGGPSDPNRLCQHRALRGQRAQLGEAEPAPGSACIGPIHRRGELDQATDRHRSIPGVT